MTLPFSDAVGGTAICAVLLTALFSFWKLEFHIEGIY